MTRKKKGDSAPYAVISNPDERILKRKGKNLTPKQHHAERNYQICLRIVCVLHADGLLTVKELAAAKRLLLKKCTSIIGTLYDEKEDNDKK